MGRTTDNLGPWASTEILTNAAGLPTSSFFQWLTSIQDYVRGRNRISDELILAATGQINRVSHLLRVKSTGGAVTLTSNPQIKSSFDGDEVVLEGVSDTHYVTLTSGNGIFLKTSPFDLKNNMTVKFHYNSAKNLWIEN